jgi:hypothetical protein
MATQNGNGQRLKGRAEVLMPVVRGPSVTQLKTAMPSIGKPGAPPPPPIAWPQTMQAGVAQPAIGKPGAPPPPPIAWPQTMQAGVAQPAIGKPGAPPPPPIAWSQTMQAGVAQPAIGKPGAPPPPPIVWPQTMQAGVVQPATAKPGASLSPRVGGLEISNAKHRHVAIQSNNIQHLCIQKMDNHGEELNQIGKKPMFFCSSRESAFSFTKNSLNKFNKKIEGMSGNNREKSYAPWDYADDIRIKSSHGVKFTDLENGNYVGSLEASACVILLMHARHYQTGIEYGAAKHFFRGDGAFDDADQIISYIFNKFKDVGIEKESIKVLAVGGETDNDEKYNESLKQDYAKLKKAIIEFNFGSLIWKVPQIRDTHAFVRKGGFVYLVNEVQGKNWVVIAP